MLSVGGCDAYDCPLGQGWLHRPFQGKWLGEAARGDQAHQAGQHQPTIREHTCTCAIFHYATFRKREVGKTQTSPGHAAPSIAKRESLGNKKPRSKESQSRLLRLRSGTHRMTSG